MNQANTDIGVVRNIDLLGRIVLPKEFRNVIGVGEGDPMSMRLLDDGSIIVKSATDLMKTCRECSYPVSTQAYFCHRCGSAIKKGG